MTVFDEVMKEQKGALKKRNALDMMDDSLELCKELHAVMCKHDLPDIIKFGAIMSEVFCLENVGRQIQRLLSGQDSLKSGKNDKGVDYIG